VTGSRPKPSAVVFDNDGLLLDTEPCWTEAQKDLFAAHGRVFDSAAKRAIIGTSPTTAAPILARLLGQPTSGPELSADMYARALAQIAAGAAPRPGALDLLARVRAAGVPVAVASNSPRSHLLAGLRRVGIEHAFDVILGVDDVANPKPAPDLYRTACAMLAASPATSVALEDSAPGVASAKAAGLYVIGVPSLPGVELAADFIAASLTEPAVLRAIGLAA
jgi:HAD superfamily hydrolase (TIGR01509 family)